ncbi:OmpA/MotB domain-containing protein [Cupriavidus basilensis OR16]|uniref:OmpA/MotB domain-containing protein n=2 Tax=Cupriavidus basilensis TaxID=68895 RepID=H1RZU3_9BURK|nr:OmpA/MotB domain-containing protein [Cupriavidus basilensis OR16]
MATAVLVALMTPAWAAQVDYSVKRDAAALQLRLDKLGAPTTPIRARAQCWIDLYHAERSQSLIHTNDTPQKALFNADQIIGALERGEKSAPNARIFSTKIYPSNDSRHGRPQWLADIRAIEKTLAAYDAKRCQTPVSACLDVAYESVMENMEETQGARWNHGRPEIDHALALVAKAKSDLAACSPPAPPVVEKPAPKLIEKTLNADALFDFDRAVLKPKGMESLAQFASDLRQLTIATAVTVTGYTDRFGSVDYNRSLSQRRADAVQQYLVGQGIKVPITATGAGAAEPIVQCAGPQNAKTIACLQPNRRVTLSVMGKAVAFEHANARGEP